MDSTTGKWSRVVSRGEAAPNLDEVQGQLSALGLDVAHNHDHDHDDSDCTRAESQQSVMEMATECWPPLGERPTSSHPPILPTPSSSSSSTPTTQGLTPTLPRGGDIASPRGSRGPGMKGNVPPFGSNTHNRPLHRGNGFSPGNSNEHPRSQFHRGNSFPPKGGSGSHFINYGHNRNNTMREHRRFNNDWYPQQGFYGRDNVAPYPRFGPSYLRQPPHPQFPIVHGYTNPFNTNARPTYWFPPSVPVDVTRGGPYFMPPTPFVPVIPQADNDLCLKIIKQVDYYFSVDNLCKDIHLRNHMDQHGWVPISLIAGFNKMKHLTSDVNLIREALRISKVVEVQADKIRMRNNWEKFLLSADHKYVVGTQSQRTHRQEYLVENETYGARLEGHLDGSSSNSETASDLGTTERVFPERDVFEDLDVRITGTK
uniref:HTH La-type RNA-binding domain-containing protein n=1 Tax=Araucaria cunninghamii TaxID=56994 RepID=A0A0D6R3H7_ARACU